MRWEMSRCLDKRAMQCAPSSQKFRWRGSHVVHTGFPTHLASLELLLGPLMHCTLIIGFLLEILISDLALYFDNSFNCIFDVG